MSAKKAGAVSQIGLWSHSDNHLAFASSQSLCVQSLGGQEIQTDWEEGGGLTRTAPDVVTVGHPKEPLLIWYRRRPKGGHYCCFTLVSCFLMSGAQHTSESVKKAAVLPEQQTLWYCFKVESRLLTSANCSHFRLEWHESVQTHAQTHTLTLASPLWLPSSTQYTHHNDLARPPLHRAHIYSTAIYPLALTAHRLCLCGFSGAPLPRCCPSVSPVRLNTARMAD